MKNIIFKCIESQCHDQQFDVNHLIMALNFSYTYLRELTYKYYSQSPRELIESIRLASTFKYIDSNLPLEVICIKCGFGNYKTFRTAFEKRLGISAAKARVALCRINNKEVLVNKWQQQIWSKGRTPLVTKEIDI